MTLSRLSLLGVVSALLLCSLGCAEPDQVRLQAYDAFRQQNYDKSQALFTKTVEINAPDWKSHYYLGLLALQHYNDSAAAVRELEICYTVRKSKANNQLGVTPGSAETAVPAPTLSQIADALAEAYYRQKNTARLAGFLKEMTHDRGDLDDYIRLGEYMQKAGDPDAAREGFMLAIKMAPSGNTAPYIAIADFYDTVGDRTQALYYLRQGYAAKPGDYEVSKRIRAHGDVPGPSLAVPLSTDEPKPAPGPAAPGITK
jgi:tetratricopeptide (TPR) repeat protein